MPTAPIDDKGSVLYFEDSGAPAGSADYVTLVLIHGTGFHSAVYRPMIPFAAEHNLRLVLVNVRGYPGSTPYSKEESDELRSPDRAVRALAVTKRGMDIAAFLCWFIETESIPPIHERTDDNARVGGLSLLSWSGGNLPTIAMLAHASELSDQTRTLLEAYFRSFIMFDPSSTIIGMELPSGLSNLRRDPSAALDVQMAQFSLAVGSYYPPYTIPDRIDPLPTYESPRQPMHQTSIDVDPKYTPTTSKMTPEEIRSITYPSILESHQHAVWAVGNDIVHENLLHAFYDCRYDDGTGAMKKVWPQLRVHLLWCDMTIGECAWAATVVYHGLQNAEPANRRVVEFHKVEGANHFIHWEEPERFVRLLAGLV
ncbi:alpha/beta-hydrolase [Cubamyces sp. BRFM 1775]|nr:alpha/beta-hydrolase [Cubamyces sp. BRFM 1775]